MKVKRRLKSLIVNFILSIFYIIILANTYMAVDGKVTHGDKAEARI